MTRAADLKKMAVWRERFRRFSRSGDSVVGFCRQERVSAPSFYVWRKRLADEGRPVGEAATRPAKTFLPVRLTSDVGPAPVAQRIEIRLPNGVQVRLPGDNLAALRAGIAAAAGLPVAAQEAASC